MKITATGCVTDPDSEPLTYQPFLGLAINDGSYKTVVLDGSKGDSEQTVIATPIEYGQNEILVGFKVRYLTFSNDQFAQFLSIELQYSTNRYDTAQETST